MLKLLYFMKLAELIGCSQESINLPTSVANVADLLTSLGQRGESWQKALGDGSGLQITINKQFVDPASAIRDGDEIAFFPKGR